MRVQASNCKAVYDKRFAREGEETTDVKGGHGMPQVEQKAEA